MTKITIDGTPYEIETLSENAQRIVASLQFVEEEMLRRRNLLAIADTARMGYTSALKRELGND